MITNVFYTVEFRSLFLAFEDIVHVFEEEEFKNVKDEEKK